MELLCIILTDHEKSSDRKIYIVSTSYYLLAQQMFGSDIHFNHKGVYNILYIGIKNLCINFSPLTVINADQCCCE